MFYFCIDTQNTITYKYVNAADKYIYTYSVNYRLNTISVWMAGPTYKFRKSTKILTR